MRIFCLVVCLAIISQACSNLNKTAQNFQLSETEKQTLQNKDPVEAVKEGQAIIDEGTRADLAKFAPKHFEMAKNYLDKCKEFINNPKNALILEKIKNKTELTKEEQEPLNEFFKNLALSKKFKEDGVFVKAIIEKEFVEIYKEREQLLSIDITTLMPSELEKVDKRINGMIDKVEEEKEKYTFDDRTPLILDMQTLEGKITIKKVLAETHKVFKQINDEDLDGQAKATVANAKEVLKSTTTFIEKNPRDTKNVLEEGNKALIAAKRAYYVGKEVKRIKAQIDNDKVEVEKVEKIVLESEALLTDIATELKMPDIRDRSLYDQSRSLVNKIRELMEEQSKDVKASSIPALEQTPQATPQPSPTPQAK